METPYKKIYLKGKIEEYPYDQGEAIAIVQDSGHYDYVSEFFEELENKCVSINYYISDENKSREELTENFLKKIYGIVEEAYLGAFYSECTGFLWVDDDCKIGGHDIIEELSNNLNKYLDMEITIHAI